MFHHDIEARLLSRLLSNLTFLPRLFSLSIDKEYNLQVEESSKIYQLVSALPKLKYIEFCDRYYQLVLINNSVTLNTFIQVILVVSECGRRM